MFVRNLQLNNYKHTQNMRKLKTAGLVYLQDNKLLLAFSKNKKAWYLPGGKVDANESSLDGLIREIDEELSYRLQEDSISYYVHIQAPAYGEDNVIMEQDCFLYTALFTATASHEIEAIQFFSFQAYQQEAILVPGVLQLFQQLIKDKLIQE